MSKSSKNIEDMTDQECMDAFQEFLQERVQLGVQYHSENSDTVITHSQMTIRCGDIESRSDKIALAYPLLPLIGAKELEQTIN